MFRSLPPILCVYFRDSVSSCSKAPWGLSVQSRVTCIFTGISISLTRVFPRTLGFSPRLPVSVYGTGGSVLARSFSWQCGIHEFVKVSFNSPSPLTLLHGGFPCHTGYRLRHALPAACSCALLRHSFTQTDCSGTGISTCSPSPMRLCLGLGPDLP